MVRPKGTKKIPQKKHVRTSKRGKKFLAGRKPLVSSKRYGKKIPKGLSKRTIVARPSLPSKGAPAKLLGDEAYYKEGDGVHKLSLSRGKFKGGSYRRESDGTVRDPQSGLVFGSFGDARPVRRGGKVLKEVKFSHPYDSQAKKRLV